MTEEYTEDELRELEKKGLAKKVTLEIPIKQLNVAKEEIIEKAVNPLHVVEEDRLVKCKFCKKTFLANSNNWQKFCSPECKYTFKSIMRRIYSLWSEDPERATQEINRLEEEGKNYRFPEPFEMFNSWYGLV